MSGHFDLTNASMPQSAYDSMPDMLALSNQGVTLFINLASQKESNGGYTLKVKLFDVNQRALLLEKILQLHN